MSGRVVVVHGPNLNLLGRREPEIYGTRSLDDLNKTVEAKAKQLGWDVSLYQSNHEGEIIDFLQKQGPGSVGIVINPGDLFTASPLTMSTKVGILDPTGRVLKAADLPRAK